MSLWRTLLAPLAPRLCAACGGAAGAAEPLCAGCRSGLRWLPAACSGAGVPAWAPVAYEGPARDVIHALKFGGRAALAGTLAAHIAARAPAGLLEGTLVPVPLHPRRLRARGFNQAHEIAVALSQRTGAAISDCLARRGDPAPQAGRARRARLEGVAGSVVAIAAAPARAVLVDDVVTTGATLAGCATALRTAGTREVVAVAWARTPGR